MTKRIAFQGTAGAYSDIACRTVFPDYETLPCFVFEDVFAAVHDGKAELAMLPIENSVAGRVADVHKLLPNGGLYIIGEHYQPVEHHLLTIPGARLEDVKEAHSHVQALAQCHHWLREHNIKPVVTADTAGAAEDVVKRGDKSIAAVASELAGVIYGLQSVASNIADLPNNTTRFFILSPKSIRPNPTQIKCVTSMLFRVRSVPAALYKALGGFATNSINITKLESYLIDGRFTAAQFYLDAEGHPDETPMKNALDELKFFAHELKVLGVYPAHKFRFE